MKTTVYLSSAKSIAVSTATFGVRVDLQTFGIPAMSQTLTADQAAVLGQALIQCAATLRKAE